MKAKVNTLYGFMCLTDDRMVANAKATHNKFINFNDIEARNIMNTKVKSYNKVVTPFGVAFVRSYRNAFEMKCKYDRDNPKKDIDFVTVLF